MVEKVWTLELCGTGCFEPGKSPAGVALIGIKLLRAFVTHGHLSLTPNQLEFTHGATIALPSSYALQRSRLTDWRSITDVDINNPETFPVELVDVLVRGATATETDPFPELTAFATAFASSPADATW